MYPLKDTVYCSNLYRLEPDLLSDDRDDDSDPDLLLTLELGDLDLYNKRLV